MALALLKLAVRNVLRNRRRSGLTLVSVIVGVAALFFNQSLIKSLQADMVARALGIFNAHIQIHSAASEDRKIPEVPFGRVTEIEAVLKNDPDVTATSKRVLFTGLVASAINSAGIMGFAVDPEDAMKISTISDYIKEGSFLTGPKQVVLGSKIAKNLDVRVGEKVVLMAQNHEGSFEGKALRVAGIFETGSYTWDTTMVYLMRRDAQELLAWNDEINAIVANVKDPTKLDQIQARLERKLEAQKNKLVVLNWKDISTEIVHIQKFQDSILYLMMTVVFAIVALGVLNTMLMSLFERIKEFGLMMALGARKIEVAFLLLVESALLGVVGLAWGAALGLSVILFFHHVGLPLHLGEALSYFLPFEKILYMRFAWTSHFWTVILIVLVSAIAGIVPALRIRRLRAAEALRHV